jgi:predicted Zn-ribbon and HTH transcriptional regulator
MDITSTKQLEDSVQTTNNFIDIKDGEKATLRIVSGIKGVKEHNIKIKDQSRSIICPEAMEEWEAQSEDRQVNKAIKCPVCKSTHMPDRRVSTKFLAIAIDDKGKVGVLKKGPTVYKTITELIEEGYKLDETPVIISRKGAGLDTEYSVLPARKDSPLTEAEQMAINTFKEGYNIDQYTKPMSYENIERKLNGQQPVFDDQGSKDDEIRPEEIDL